MLEESIRLPLIVHWPDAAKGTRCDWPLNNTDFAPTMLAAAGVPVPESMQGRSFLGALQGEAEPADWRQSTYYRYWMHMAHGHNNPAHFGIRNKRHKLIFYYGTDFTDVHAGKAVEKRGGNRFWKNTPAGKTRRPPGSSTIWNGIRTKCTTATSIPNTPRSLRP